LASEPPDVKWPPDDAGNPARCATMRMTCASSATAAGEVAELATCGLKEPTIRSAHCAGKLGAGLNSPK